MNELMLFTDASVNPKTGIGYGARLIISEPGLALDSLKFRVSVRRFENTSSTKLELQTLLWALNDVHMLTTTVTAYTDSQNILSLYARRARLEKNDYRSKKNQRLNHRHLYQAFYGLTDQLDCQFVKVRGHQVSNLKDDIDRIFALVDRASRNALRENYR